MTVAAEWKTRSFGEIAQFRNGLNFVKSDNGELIKIVGVSDFQRHFRISYEGLDYVQISGSVSSDDLLENNDLLFVRSNGNKALIGRCILIENVDEPISFSGFTIRARVNDSNVFPEFAGIYFQSSKARADINESGAGSQISNLSQGILSSIEIPVPPLKEQRAIAEALSDVDALINALDALITKKRHIKQGTMQQLLTGKKRLPGFSGDWEEVTLGELGEFKNGINKDKEGFGFGFPFVNLMDVFGIPQLVGGKGLKLINSNPNERQQFDVRKGDVLFVRSSVKPSGVGLTSAIQCDLPDTVFSGFLIRFRDNGRLNLAFKTYCFYEAKFRQSLIASSSVSANTNINQDALKGLSIKIPKTKDEQAAIAEVLSDMDAEITALEQKRDKTKLIKQGMMQELLTGKTRLL